MPKFRAIKLFWRMTAKKCRNDKQHQKKTCRVSTGLNFRTSCYHGMATGLMESGDASNNSNNRSGRCSTPYVWDVSRELSKVYNDPGFTKQPFRTRINNGTCVCPVTRTSVFSDLMTIPRYVSER